MNIFGLKSSAHTWNEDGKLVRIKKIKEIENNIIDDKKCIGVFLLETKLKGFNKEIFIEGTR